LETNLTVFIVDDDDAVRDSLAALINAAGFAAAPFASAEAFLEAYEPQRSGCLLVDVRMPGMTGLELQNRLAHDKVSLPVIILTGHADVPMAVTAMKNGAVEFIEKPHREDELLDGVKRALGIARRQGAREASAKEVADRMARLTRRERDVLDGVVAGRQNKVIAHDLGISARTVEIHRARVMAKMQVANLAHLLRTVLAAGIGDC